PLRAVADQRRPGAPAEEPLSGQHGDDGQLLRRHHPHRRVLPVRLVPAILLPSMASPVFITRHGQSEHNLETRFYMGRSPASCFAGEGRPQAQRLAERLAGDGRVRHVVASSLPRTVETAQIVATRLGLAPVHTDDAFWELSKGEWEGRMPRHAPPPEV